MKFILFIILQFLYLFALCQKPIGILCTDFQINDERRDEGISYRKSLESVLAALKTPPLIIDREKIPELIIKIQEEVNLSKDLNVKYRNDLRAANIDFVMYGNFDKKFSSETYDLQLQCIKISGANIFSKKPFPILTFTEKELRSSISFRKKLDSMLSKYAFTDEFGIIENEQLNLINKRLDEKDTEIHNLSKKISDFQNDATIKTQTINALSASVIQMQKNDSIKNIEILNLKEGLSGFKDYLSVAKLEVDGIDQHFGFGMTGWKTELYNLMNRVLNVDSAKHITFKTDDSSFLTLTKVIEKYPKFPFGYYGKTLILLNRQNSEWVSYAIKACQILKITTTIDGHNKNHDVIYEELKQLLFINNIIWQ